MVSKVKSFADMKPNDALDEVLGTDLPGDPAAEAEQRRFDADAAEVVDKGARLDPAIDQDEIEERQRLRRLITTADFLPGRSKEWAIQNVASRPRGTYIPLGLLDGMVNAIERKAYTATPTGGGPTRALESIWLKGSFEATIAATGEIIRAPNCILPLALGEMIEASFRQGNERASLDCEIGLEATGRMIPYEWVVISYVSGEAASASRARRQKKQARLAAMIERKAIAAPTA
jgi:hypothetical protein